MLKARKSFQKKEKSLAFKEIQKCYNCEKLRHLSQQCKNFCNDERKIITTTLHNSLNWTACQDDMCKVYINNKDRIEWYSQKWQKKHRSYNTTEVFTKEIMTFDQINIEEINTHNTQKENFPKYNKEVYISEDYKFNKASREEILTLKCIYHKNKNTQNNRKSKNKIIRQKKIWKKTVKQIKAIVKKVFNIVWKSQKSESPTELYNSRWILAENDIQDKVL